jgi:hypothetical protein
MTSVTIYSSVQMPGRRRTRETQGLVRCRPCRGGREGEEISSRVRLPCRISCKRSKSTRIRDDHGVKPAGPYIYPSTARERSVSYVASELALLIMAANYRRPLLVLHKVTSGHSVYDLNLKDEQTLEVHPSHYPVVEKALNYRPLAVAASTILGVTPRPRHLLVDPWTNAVVSELEDPCDTGPPIMLPVGESMVIRMDTVIYGGDVSARFEAPRFVPSTGGWDIFPLPRPPLGTFERVAISAYFVMGTRVWVSVTSKGTFSLDAEHGTWRAEFPEELRRLQRRALFVPELDSVVGLTPAEDQRLLCAYRFNEKGVLSWKHTWAETIPSEWFHSQRTRPTSEMVDLAYLGNGRFCVCRPAKMLENGITDELYLNSFLVLELRRLPDGELKLIKRGMLRLHGLWSQGTCQGVYFLQ